MTFWDLKNSHRYKGPKGTPETKYISQMGLIGQELLTSMEESEKQEICKQLKNDKMLSRILFGEKVYDEQYKLGASYSRTG